MLVGRVATIVVVVVLVETVVVVVKDSFANSKDNNTGLELLAGRVA